MWFSVKTFHRWRIDGTFSVQVNNAMFCMAFVSEKLIS